MTCNKNPNNCSTCNYKQMVSDEDKLWCYMHAQAPEDVCYQHTGRQKPTLQQLHGQLMTIFGLRT